MENVFNYLLVVLCISDLLVILSSFVHALNSLSTTNYFTDELVVINDSVSHIAATFSIFLTMAITIERYFGVCSAFTYQARVVEKGPSPYFVFLYNPSHSRRCHS